MSSQFTNSSMLLHLDKALEALHQGDAKQRKVFLRLMNSLPLLRVGYLSWVDPGDLHRMERQPIRWGLAQAGLGTANAAYWTSVSSCHTQRRRPAITAESWQHQMLHRAEAPACASWCHQAVQVCHR